MAQSRVFVGGQGSDANPCTFVAPCRTFQHAHDTAAAKGEIDVLDPAGYGALNISKSISIQGHGFAGLAVPSGAGITINAGASDVVNLRGLLIDGSAGGTTGINFGAGASLNVQECAIRGFNGPGIFFSPNGAGELFVSNTVISDNHGGAGIGLLPSAAGTVTAVLDRVDMDNNGEGVLANGALSTGSIAVTIAGSVISNNGANGGVSAFASSGQATTVIMVRDSTLSGNTVGLQATGAAAVVRITRSTITGNSPGFATASGGQIVSFGDNSLAGNSPDGTPTSTIAPK
jgi:hypothetical protein